MKSLSHPHFQSFKDLFQFDHVGIEAQVEKVDALYPGLALEALYTQLEDLYQIQTHPMVNGRWCDLGAGVGMSALLYGKLFPEREAMGIELSASRFRAGVLEKERLQLANVNLINADLLECQLPIADTYFLYFPTGTVLDRILDELAKRDNYLLVAIESHGDLFPRLDQEPSLKMVEAIPLKGQRHHPQARFYHKINSALPKNRLFSLSYQEWYLQVSEQNEWWGESLGLEWLGEENFNLKYPPRSIKSSQVKKILSRAELDPVLLNLCQLRRLGELSLKTSQGVIHAFIRKIAKGDGFSLELSTGEWVEWKEIRSIIWKNHLCYDASACSFFLPPAP